MSSPHHQPQVDGSTSSTAGPGGQPFPAAKSLSGFQEHPFVSPPGIRVLTAPTIASPEMLPHHFKFPLILSTLCCSSSLRGMLSQLPHFSCVVTCSCYGTNECDAPLLLNPECHRLSLFSPLTQYLAQTKFELSLQKFVIVLFIPIIRNSKGTEDLK